MTIAIWIHMDLDKNWKKVRPPSFEQSENFSWNIIHMILSMNELFVLSKIVRETVFWVFTLPVFVANKKKDK